MNIELLEQLDDVCLVGHPFAPMGMGEHIRSVFRSLRAVGANPGVFDVYKLSPRDDPSLKAELECGLVDKLSSTLNIFHLNGDEVSQALEHIGGTPSGSLNIVYPAWELPQYPKEWAMELERFDEVWAPSAFVRDSMQSAVSRPVHHMTLACEVRMRQFMGRRHFGIPESAFAFLYFFDFTSFIARKNPHAVLEAFSEAYRQCGEPDACLVLKLNRGDLSKADYENFLSELKRRPERIVLIDKTLNDDEMKNLVRCCDAFVSLHRSEGYGRGMSEAMVLDRAVIATGWSGNLDFMSSESVCLVDNTLIPVMPGEYPHGDGQYWAEPNVEHAAAFMVRMMKNRSWAAQLGKIAGRHMRISSSYRARGLEYAERLMELLDSSCKSADSVHAG